MMNRNLWSPIFFAALLMPGLLAAQSVAQSQDPGSNNLFVGHYGETFKSRTWYAIEPEMKGPVEVIRIYPRFTEDKDGSPRAFKAKPSDYKSENFTPMRLMQVVVMPKDLPGTLGDLKKIYAAKEKELKEQGAEFQIFKENFLYPPDTFTVWITKPHELRQLYTQSKGEIYIVTSGYRGKGYAGHIDQFGIVTGTLAQDLVSQFPQDKEIAAPSIWLEFFKIPRFSAPMAVAVCLALLFLMFPLPRLRLAAKSMLAFSGAGFLYGFLFALIMVAILPRHFLNEGGILLVLIILAPWLCQFLSRRLGGESPRRVFKFSLGLAIPLALLGMGLSILIGSTEWQIFPATASYYCFWAGLFFGICFGLVHSPTSKKV